MCLEAAPTGLSLVSAAPQKSYLCASALGTGPCTAHASIKDSPCCQQRPHLPNLTAFQPDHYNLRIHTAISLSMSACRYRIINQLVDFRYEAARVAEVKRRFLRLDQCIPLEGFLTGWFLGAPIESICRGNVEDFVAYGFYSRYMHELPPHVRPCAISTLPPLVLCSRASQCSVWRPPMCGAEP